MNKQVSLEKLQNTRLIMTIILCVVAAPVAGDNESLTFGVGDDLVLAAYFSNFNLVLDEIAWTQNSSLSLVDGVGGVFIASSDLSALEATSTLTRPNIAGLSYAGTYVATASNRAGSSSMAFTVEITGNKTCVCIVSGMILSRHHIQLSQHCFNFVLWVFLTVFNGE